MSAELARERVAAGAAWLAEEAPGWAQCIDTGRLCMSIGNWCIAGQLFVEQSDPVDLENGYAWLECRMGSRWCKEHGFLESSMAPEVTAEELHAAWLAVIAVETGVLA